MKKRFKKLLTVGSAWYLLTPQIVSAAGEKATDLVVVADTRVLPSGIMKYFANLYNTDPIMFAVWAAALTAIYGCVLGVLMDKIMGMTGLDLKSRKIVEH